MGQLKRRLYTLGLSLLVLIVALAGLLSVLDILNSATVSSTSNAGSASPTTTPADIVQKPPETPSKPPPTTPNVNITPKLALSLPDSFNLDVSRATEPELSLNNTGTATHYPVLEVTGAENTEYLKSLTASYYDGTEWKQEEFGEYIEYNGELLIPPGINPAQIVTDNITVATLVDIVNGKVAIPTSLYPVSVNSSEPLLYFPEDMTFLAEEEFPEEYVFQTIHFVFERGALANADLDSIQKYLQLPENITPRTYELAKDITGGIESPFLMAKAIEDYLKTNYTYDFEFDPAPSGHEPNDWFLFEEKSGVCTNFNSAFVILCRAAGIPARLAGGFHIEATGQLQEVFTDQAHAWAEVKFKELGWYTFDATGSPGIKLKQTTTEITRVNPVATKGDEFTVEGTVYAGKAEPADGLLVEILINKTKEAKGAAVVGRGIVSGGRFKITAVVPSDMAVGQYQVMAHCLKTSRYEESWSDPVIKVVSGTKITLSAPDRIKAGQTIILNGLLSGEYGERLAGQNVQIYLDGALRDNLVTDSDGKFKWSGTFNLAGDYLLSASYAGNEYFLEADAEIALKVLAPAVIAFKAEGQTAGKPVVFTGSLQEQTTKVPLAGRSLDIIINGTPRDAPVVTDKKGEFKFEYIFDEKGKHSIEVRFAGDMDYYETGAALQLEISVPGGFPVLPLTLIALAAAGVATAWVIFLRTKRQPITVSLNKQNINQNETPAPWQRSDSGLRLTLDFPQIKEPLPDVWGAGEEMTIAFRLTDETGTGVAAALELIVNGEVITRPETAKDGKTEVPFLFPAKGQYELVARYEGPNDKKAAPDGHYALWTTVKR